jgi:putative transposase
MRHPEPELEHWILRARGDTELFRTDADRQAFVELLGALLPRAGLSCAAWVLLTHHVELLVVRPAGEPPGDAAPVMQALVVGYARDFNRRHTRSGYVFAEQTPPRMLPVDRRAADAVRDIHRTPISSGAVRRAADLDAYHWCGHASLAGRRTPLPFEEPELLARWIPRAAACDAWLDERPLRHAPPPS